MTEEQRLNEIIERLSGHYDTGRATLDHETPWQLLFSTILSAQCTDARVNIVTKTLYRKYPDVKSFADADLDELMEDVKPCGFYRNKARNLKACAAALLEKYNGEVPSDIDELTKLPGVGRKTANVIRGNIYHIPSIVVDTHVKRISYRLGVTEETDPVKVEFDLMDKLPEEAWIMWNLVLIEHGRKIGMAKSPDCANCFLNDICPKKEPPKS